MKREGGDEREQPLGIEGLRTREEAKEGCRKDTTQVGVQVRICVERDMVEEMEIGKTMKFKTNIKIKVEEKD